MKFSPIIKPNQNKVNINQIHKAIVNSNIISKTKQAYNKITVKSAVPQNNLETEVKNESNSQTQKQIIDIASQKLIRIVKNMTTAENAFLAEKKGYVKNNKIARKTIKYANYVLIRNKIKKQKSRKLLLYLFLMQFFSLLLSINLNTNRVNAKYYKEQIFRVTTISQKNNIRILFRNMHTLRNLFHKQITKNNVLQGKANTQIQVRHKSYYISFKKGSAYHASNISYNKGHGGVMDADVYETEGATQEQNATTTKIPKQDENLKKVLKLNDKFKMNMSPGTQYCALKPELPHWQQQELRNSAEIVRELTPEEDEIFQNAKNVVYKNPGFKEKPRKTFPSDSVYSEKNKKENNDSDKTDS